MALVVIALALLLMLATTATFAATAFRLEGVTSTLLAAYVVLVAEVTALTTALSAFEAVTRTGLATGEAVVLAAATAFWWRRGRPRLGNRTRYPLAIMVSIYGSARADAGARRCSTGTWYPRCSCCSAQRSSS